MVICIDHWRTLWQVCVSLQRDVCQPIHFDSFKPTLCSSRALTGMLLFSLSIHMHACCMHSHKWMHVYSRRARASIFLPVFSLRRHPHVCTYLWSFVNVGHFCCEHFWVHVCVRQVKRVWVHGSSVLGSKRSAWLPSLYEPLVQSDRNKKPYTAPGIVVKTGF